VVVEKGGYRGAWVGYAEHDEDRTVRVVAHHGVDERFIAQVKVSWADTNIGRGPTGTTIRTGKPTVVRDMLTDPSIVPWREEVTRLGYVSGISLPLRIRDNVVGVITLYSANLAEFGDAEIRLLTEMADDLAFGIATLRLQEEARRSEAALHAHEQRLALHVRQTPLAVIEWTPDFKVMEWNPAAEAMFGYSRAEALGRHGSFIFLPDTGREPDTVRSALKARAGHAHNVIENVAKGGEEIFCEWHNAELVDTEGNHIGATSVVQNVTDRERAQRDRARTEKRFVDLFEFSPDALVMADREGVIAAINRQAEKMFAWSRAELVGKKIEVLVPEYLRSAHVGLRGRFMQSPAVRAMGGGSANLQVQRRDGTFFPAEIGLSPMESDAGRMVIAAARDVTERKRAEETIRKLAYFDSRTGLPNRVQLRERLKEAVAKAQTQNQSLALLIPRINNFPDLQDGLGLRRAETLLQQIAQRFRAMVSGDEMLAHLGEDDFAILLPEGDARYATDVAQKMLQAMHEPFTLESLDIDVQISIGIALYPGHGTEPDALILRGDIAARQARQGGHDYAIYAGATDQESPQRLSLITELRRAIESDQLTLYYQPKVDVRTGLVCGAEALVRWQHPERGMIPPVNFIPLAEHTGLIKPLTYWVIDAATRQCAAWQKAGLKAPVAVNLSVENLRDPRLLDTIKGSFATWGLPPECLQVEITESALMSDPTKSLAVLTHLKEIGIKLFIDDFGTGYSSLGYLATLPVHALKIDRSFIIRMVNEPDHMTIVSSTISLAHSLKLKVVAEGVDAEDQAQSLRRLKCDEIQGYLYSPPLPPEKFQDWQAKFTLNVGEPKGKGSSS
jgi:diguanylate cyclase